MDFDKNPNPGIRSRELVPKLNLRIDEDFFMAKNNLKFSWIVTASVVLFLSSCSHTPETPMGSEFSKAFDCPEDRGWVVLKRPNSIWNLGTVLEITQNGAEDMGNIQSLNCFPPDAWTTEEGETASANYSSVGKYGMSLAGTLGIPKTELVKLGILVGGDTSTNEQPNHSVVFETQSAKEKRLSYLMLEGFVADHYNDMTANCKRAIATKNRYLVDGLLQINKGNFKVVNNQGVTVDLSSPSYKTIQDAAIKAGYQISSTGSIVMTEDKPPMSVCVRARRFDDVLASIGVISRGEKSLTFDKAMDTIGLKVSKE